jgi:hypothetical protein
MLSWYSDESRWLETVRVVITERGLRANGYIIEATDNAFGVSYSLLVDAAGRTRRLTVQSDTVEGERHIALTRTPGGPWVVESAAGTSPLFGLDGAQDLDIDHSAFTNALCMRRMALTSWNGRTPPWHQELANKVGSVSIPTLAVRPVEHVYTFRSETEVHFRGPDRETDLTVDELNIPVDVAGLGRRLRTRDRPEEDAED